MTMKKLILPLITVFMFLFVINFVSAGLCKGYDGYYHDCNYYGNHYSKMNYFSGSHGGKAGYDNSIKLNYYASKKSSWRNDVDSRDRMQDDLIMFIRDNSDNIDNEKDGRIHIRRNIRNVRNVGYDKWFDSDPYHHLTTRTFNIRSMKYSGEEHCPYGFVCAKGDWF